MTQIARSSPIACAVLAFITGILLGPVVLAVLAYRQQKYLLEADSKYLKIDSL